MDEKEEEEVEENEERIVYAENVQPFGRTHTIFTFIKFKIFVSDIKVKNKLS